jgi:hypothetical protein
VICPKPVGVGEAGTVGSLIPKWTIRATDDQDQTCLIEINAKADETDAQLKRH